jgi:uncharacterized protein YqhQ
MKRYSGIGGQAVMEGVMMRNKNRYAVACRKPDGEIVVDVKETHSITEKLPFLGWPFLRGTVSLIESMVIGIKTLMYSADFIEDDAPAKKTADAANATANDNISDNTTEEAQTADGTAATATAEPKKPESAMTPFMIFCTIALSLGLSIGLFFFLPLLIAEGVEMLTGWDSPFAVSCIEGVTRILIFVGYVAAISLLPDIKRVYRYHGAEHKSINCIESGLPLTVENARASSKEHKRCGTSFLIIVIAISILVFSIVNCFVIYDGDSRIIKILVRFGIRLLLLPLVAGISYEFLRLAGRSESRIVNILSRPGIWMQGLTTKEPDDAMLECAIASVEAVFDWKAFINGEQNDLSGSTQNSDGTASECTGSGCGL